MYPARPPPPAAPRSVASGLAQDVFALVQYAWCGVSLLGSKHLRMSSAGLGRVLASAGLDHALKAEFKDTYRTYVLAAGERRERERGRESIIAYLARACACVYMYMFIWPIPAP